MKIPPASGGQERSPASDVTPPSPHHRHLAGLRTHSHPRYDTVRAQRAFEGLPQMAHTSTDEGHGALARNVVVTGLRTREPSRFRYAAQSIRLRARDLLFAHVPASEKGDGRGTKGYKPSAPSPPWWISRLRRFRRPPMRRCVASAESLPSPQARRRSTVAPMRGSAAAREEAPRVDGEEAPANDAKGAPARHACELIRRADDVYGAEQPIPTTRRHRVQKSTRACCSARRAPHTAYEEAPHLDERLPAHTSRQRHPARARSAEESLIIVSPVHSSTGTRQAHSRTSSPEEGPPRTVHVDDEALAVPRLRRTPEGKLMGPGSAEKERGSVVDEDIRMRGERAEDAGASSSMAEKGGADADAGMVVVDIVHGSKARRMAGLQTLAG
ncbi:hypothetical protein DFH09DRAFT_1372704 [Mycena vulgaris]|nr:hypothetical protein DFH09DRAFT_1372704 [Mycena vulgaris]